ncbi:hypothetical protein FJTKL_14023 [Diaporthe vaccinii]|uniref:Uncharacterized protein n=1 Tax=Diaporthe vaccinii TaxID=105482 RepID=A0ABR4E9F2_9PEZI
MKNFKMSSGSSSPAVPWREEVDREMERPDDGYWDDDDVNPDGEDAGASARPRGESLLESGARYVAVMTQLAEFFGDRDETFLSNLCARGADRPDLCREYPLPADGSDISDSGHIEEWNARVLHSEGEDKDDVSYSEGEHGVKLAPSEDEDRDDISHSEGEHRVKLAPSEDGEGQEQEETSVVWQPLSLLGHSVEWPADGFSDDDPATVYVADIYLSYRNRCVNKLGPEDITIFRTPDAEDTDFRPFQQVLRCGDDVAGTNFHFQNPDRPKGHVMGKADFSKFGLHIIIQALRDAVSDYEDTVSIPSHRQTIDRINASNGAINFERHLEDRLTCYVFVEPYTPEGIRSAMSALQAAARYSSSGRVLFYAHPMTFAARKGRFGALLDVHPIIGWEC